MSEYQVLMQRAIDLATSRGARYADIRMAVLTEIGICEEAALFTERLATEPPCNHLPAILLLSIAV